MKQSIPINVCTTQSVLNALGTLGFKVDQWEAMGLASIIRRFQEGTATLDDKGRLLGVSWGNGLATFEAEGDN